MNNLSQKILASLVPVVLALIGGSLTNTALRNEQIRKQAEKWPVTTATITSVNQEDYRHRSRSRTNVVTIKTSYAYVVGGTKYEGNKIHPHYKGSNHVSAQCALGEALEPGRRVQVRYNPEFPADSYLATGFLSGSLSKLAFGILFLSGGLSFCLVIWTSNGGNRFTPAFGIMFLSVGLSFGFLVRTANGDHGFASLIRPS